MTDYRILEVKHHSPFIGAWWQWNYFLLDIEDGEVFGVQEIYAATTSDARHHHMTLGLASELYEEWEHGEDSPSDTFDTPTVYEIDDKLDKNLPGNMTPVFCQFFNGGYDDGAIRDIGIPFVWRCVHGGELTSSYPVLDVDTHGAGGIALDTDGWVCEDHEGDYCFDRTLENTHEVLRMEFSQYFEDETVPNDDAVYKIVEWMIENERYFDTREDGGKYPKDEQVKRALEALGYHEMEEAE